MGQAARDGTSDPLLISYVTFCEDALSALGVMIRENEGDASSCAT